MRSVATFALLSICACASTNSPSGSGSTATRTATDTRSCASPYVPAVAETNASVFERPDSTSTVIGSVPVRTGVCASTSTVGFGFRRVKLANGMEGYMQETALIDSGA